MRIKAVLIATLFAAAAAVASAAPVCPPRTVFSTALDHLDGYRVFTGSDGDSEFAPLRIDARIVPLFKTGKKLGIIDLPKAGSRGPGIVIGAADVDLSMHPTPYKEMFVMLGGSVTLKAAKFTAELGPGSVLQFEDVQCRPISAWRLPQTVFLMRERGSGSLYWRRS